MEQIAISCGLSQILDISLVVLLNKTIIPLSDVGKEIGCGRRVEAKDIPSHFLNVLLE